MFDSVFKNKVEMGTTFYLRHDGAFSMEERPLYKGCLVQKKGEKILDGWLPEPKVRFNGYKKMKAGMVTLTCGADIIFDPYRKRDNQVEVEEAIKTHSKFLTYMFELSVFTLVETVKEQILFEKIALIEGATIIILALGIVLAAVT